MTITRGAAWGQPWDGGDWCDLDSDAAVAEALARGVTVRASGGDLAATVGTVGRTGPPAQRCPVDLGLARTELGERIFAAHCIARRSWWRGPLVAVMNAQYLGRYDVAPRGHPNDGRLDTLQVERMALRQRRSAWRRLPRGDHLPHPAIIARSVTSHRWEFGRALDIYVDGCPWGRTTWLEIEVQPGAGELAI